MSFYTLTILIVYLIVMTKLVISYLRKCKSNNGYMRFKQEFTVVENNSEEHYIDIKYVINGIVYFQRVVDLGYKEKVVEQHYKSAVSKLKKNKYPAIYHNQELSSFVYSNPRDWFYLSDYVKLSLSTIVFVLGCAFI